MARVVGASTAAAIALLVLVALVSSAASKDPRCCVDFRQWSDNGEQTGCESNQNNDCDMWCQSQCRGGECKLRGNLHYCHCYR